MTNEAQDLEGLLRRRPERSEEVLEGVFKSCYPDQIKKNSTTVGFFFVWDNTEVKLRRAKREEQSCGS